MRFGGGRCARIDRERVDRQFGFLGQQARAGERGDERRKRLVGSPRDDVGDDAAAQLADLVDGPRAPFGFDQDSGGHFGFLGDVLAAAVDFASADAPAAPRAPSICTTRE